MPAAMLVLTCIACNQPDSGTTSANQKSGKKIAVQDVMMEEAKPIYAPAPQEMQKFAPPQIVRDDEMKSTGTQAGSDELEDSRTGIISHEGLKDEGIVAPPVSDAAKGRIDALGDFNTEGYGHAVDNAFQRVVQHPLSTFSIDVDQASYSNVRRFIMNGSLPPAGAVRIEEMVNYFDYAYAQPTGPEPFAVQTELAASPWSPEHRLLHIGLQGRQVAAENLPAANLVFLIDVSGSMDEPNKLPLVKASMKLLTDQLRENDRVAIVVYAGSAGLVLPSTSGSTKKLIRQAIDKLEAGGSTAGGEGIELAYKTAQAHFIKGGNNRVILATDGDFNVGESSDDSVVSLIENKKKSGIFLSVLGYGMGNYQDNKMQQLADKGNGNHFYIDNFNEARKVLLKEFGSTLYTIAKDVKIQIEFNPQKVAGYRLIGYENRVLAAEDFNDDRKDAGELGAGHTATALYEIIPIGVKDNFTVKTDSLKYQLHNAVSTISDEIATIRLRYKKPDSDNSSLIATFIYDKPAATEHTSENFRFSAAVAEFGMLLRNSPYKQEASVQQVLLLANGAAGKDPDGYRREFIQLVASAGAIFTARK